MMRYRRAHVVADEAVKLEEIVLHGELVLGFWQDDPTNRRRVFTKVTTPGDLQKQIYDRAKRHHRLELVKSLTEKFTKWLEGVI